MSDATPPDKVCPICGRRFSWRRKWADDWEHVRYCSKRCRGRTLDDVDRALEAETRALAAARGRKATFCPSEVARAVAEDWRPLLPRTHDAVRRLAEGGVVEILQRGQRRDPSDVRGAYRVRRGRG